MKSLKKGKVVQRVSEATAQNRNKLQGLLNEGWKFCPKSEWRAYKNAQKKKGKQSKANKKLKN